MNEKIQSAWLSLILLFLIACNSDDSDRAGYRYFTLSIDSVSVPDSIQFGEKLVIRYWGYIGPNGCYSFAYFEKRASSDSLFVKVWGKQDTAAFTCHAGEMVLRGEPCSFKNLNRGQYQIISLQPDGSCMKNQVIVR